MTSAVYGVPTSEALRRAALSASWRRDRVVGRRTRAWRWVAWTSTRLGLPVAASLILGQGPAGLPAPVAAEGSPLKLTRSLPLARSLAAPPVFDPVGDALPLALTPKLASAKKESR
jgi:hypothetical protein